MRPSRLYLVTRAIVRSVVWLVIGALLPLYVIAACFLVEVVWR